MPDDVLPSYVGTPHKGVWNGFSQHADILLQRLSPQDRKGFLQLLAASYFLSPEQAPPEVLDWLIANHTDLPCDLALMQSSRWARIAYVVVRKTNSSDLLYLLVGIGPEAFPLSLPQDIEDYFKQDALTAIKQALQLACEKTKTSPDNFFLWPIISKDLGQSKVHGRSIALPTYLGFLSLANNQEVPQRILCTGELDFKGELVAVGGLQEKYKEAKIRRFDSFLYPHFNNSGQQDELCKVESSQVELLPAETLKEAERYWNKYSPGEGNAVRLFIEWLKDPVLIVEHICDMPDSLFPLLEDEIAEVEKQFHAIFNTAAQAKERYGHLVTKLERYMQSSHYSRPKVDNILHVIERSCFNGIDNLSRISLKLAFRLALAQLRHANHAGNISASRLWIDRALTIFHDLSADMHIDNDDDRNRFLFLFISIIGIRHNIFWFHHSLPEDMTEELSEFESSLLSVVQKRRKKTPAWCGPEADCLGQFYGTMMQHYAFCGPGFMEDTLKKSGEALDAFGYQGKGPPNENCRRQLSYQVYAFLDAGEISKAEEALLGYLGAELLEKVSPSHFTDPIYGGDDPYKHAVMARFLADSGNEHSAYLSKVLKDDPANLHHPWQLWLYNLGRLVAEHDMKKKLWFRSLEMCESGGVTVQVMALLPLSALVRLELKPKEFETVHVHAKKALKLLDENPDLHRPHFIKILKKPDWKTSLTEVHANVSRYFPFSYR